jgi:hypothetical protein
MLKYLQSKYGGKVEYAWSVGNEPDLWGDGVSGQQVCLSISCLVVTMPFRVAAHAIVGGDRGVGARMTPPAVRRVCGSVWRRGGGGQLAEDALTLKQLLKGFSLGSAVYGPSYAHISGADVAEFLSVAAAGGVDGLTVHNYPYGKPCAVNKWVPAWKHPPLPRCAGPLGAGMDAAHPGRCHCSCAHGATSGDLVSVRAPSNRVYCAAAVTAT